MNTYMTVNVHVAEKAEVWFTDWTSARTSDHRPYVTVEIAGVTFFLHHPDQVAAMREAFQEAELALLNAGALDSDAVRPSEFSPGHIEPPF